MKVEIRKRRFLYHIIYKYMSNSFKLNTKKNHIKKKKLNFGSSGNNLFSLVYYYIYGIKNSSYIFNIKNFFSYWTQDIIQILKITMILKLFKTLESKMVKFLLFFPNWTTLNTMHGCSYTNIYRSVCFVGKKKGENFLTMLYM